MIKQIIGIEEAEKMPGIQQISVVHGKGQQVHAITSSSERIGFVIAQGEDPEDAITRCENAMDRISIVME